MCMGAALLVPVLLYNRETILSTEKEKPMIRAVQMVNFRVLVGIRRTYRVSNIWRRELCGVMKGVDEWIERNVL